MLIHRVDPAAAADAHLVERLTRLVNDVYADAERGLWRDGAERTDAAEMAGLIRAGELLVARDDDGRIVGSVRLHDVAPDIGEFGILVAAPDRRGEGIGRRLADAVEDEAFRSGRRAIRLELLVPREGTHPSKVFLRRWYERRGYRVIAARGMDQEFPHLAPLLAVPCDLLAFEKPLRPA